MEVRVHDMRAHSTRVLIRHLRALGLAKHIFVGVVDLQKRLSLMRYSTKLYLVGHGVLTYVRAPAPICPFSVDRLIQRVVVCTTVLSRAIERSCSISSGCASLRIR